MRLLSWLAGCLLLASCAVAPPPPSGADGTRERAEQAQAAGRLSEAALLWMQASESATEPERSQYLLRAAETWAATGRHDEAGPAIEAIDPRQLQAPERSRLALLEAERALLAGDADAAALYLQTARIHLPSEQAVRFQALQDSLLRLEADPAGDLLSRITRDLGQIRAADPDQAALLLLSLEDVTSGLLAEAAALGAGSPAGRWAELAWRVRRTAMRPDSVRPAAERWASDFPGQAIGKPEFVDVVEAYARAHPAPSRVAILVPTSGSLSSAGSAIRDGLLSAYFEHPSASTLRFYEPGETPEQAIVAYRQAVADGAQWVIGPVRKESVEALARLPDLTVPVLLLNDAGEATTSTTQRFSLSLSQEEEARAVAARMMQQGIARTITLSADNSWGSRMEEAFRTAYLAAGGQITAAARLPMDESDHSAQIIHTLEIDQSLDRRNRLQSILGKSLEFEPHVRQDFDGFFLSAPVEQARQLKPQLKFHEAGEVPVFAMSRVYSGIPDRSADQDLNGIFVPLTAVQLDLSQGHALPELDSIRRGSLINLYGLGSDAWALLSWLPLMLRDPDLEFLGASGRLRLEPSGHIAREPAWAVFSGGQPIAVTDTPRAEQDN